MFTITAVASAGTPPRPAICTSRGVVVAVPSKTRAVGNGVYEEPGIGAAASATGSCADAELGRNATEASAPARVIAHTVRKTTMRFMRAPYPYRESVANGADADYR